MLSSPTPLSEPNLMIINSSTVQINWESSSVAYLIEYCNIKHPEWLPVHDYPLKTNYTMSQLVPGESYSFRLVCPDTKVPSIPSLAVTLPLNENHVWQQQQVSLNSFFFCLFCPINEKFYLKKIVLRRPRDNYFEMFPLKS